MSNNVNSDLPDDGDALFDLDGSFPESAFTPQQIEQACFLGKEFERKCVFLGFSETINADIKKLPHD